MEHYTRMKFCLIYTVFVTMLVLTGCEFEAQGLTDADSDLSNYKHESNSQLNNVNNDILDIWLGEYLFSESSPHVNPNAPDIYVEYHINIFEENNEYLADVYVDGFQTMKRFRAKVSGDDNKIDLLFENYLIENNSINAINKGERLLSLEKCEAGIFAQWGNLKPMLSESKTEWRFETIK